MDSSQVPVTELHWRQVSGVFSPPHRRPPLSIVCPTLSSGEVGSLQEDPEDGRYNSLPTSLEGKPPEIRTAARTTQTNVRTFKLLAVGTYKYLLSYHKTPAGHKCCIRTRSHEHPALLYYGALIAKYNCKKKSFCLFCLNVKVSRYVLGTKITCNNLLYI